jgi:hypothetical protein
MQARALAANTDSYCPARVGRNKRSVLRRMGVDGTGIASSPLTSDYAALTRQDSYFFMKLCEVCELSEAATPLLFMRTLFCKSNISVAYSEALH